MDKKALVKFIETEMGKAINRLEEAELAPCSTASQTIKNLQKIANENGKLEILNALVEWLEIEPNS